MLSPTMMIMEDEVDSFWCFKGIMDMMVRYCFLEKLVNVI